VRYVGHAALRGTCFLLEHGFFKCQESLVRHRTGRVSRQTGDLQSRSGVPSCYYSLLSTRTLSHTISARCIY